MRYVFNRDRCQNVEYSSRREWLLTNGIGGYAMGTVSGINTRRYHGHLVAATRPPTERTLLLANLEASAASGGAQVWLSANQYPGAVFPDGYRYLEWFSAGRSIRWHYLSGSVAIEKSLSMMQGKNAICANYRNAGESSVLLIVRPLIALRSYHGTFNETPRFPNSVGFPPGLTRIEHSGTVLSLAHPGAQCVPVQGWYYRFEHAREIERGLEPRDDLYCPCELRFDLESGAVASISAAEGDPVAPWFPDWNDQDENLEFGHHLEEMAGPFLVKSESRLTIVAGYPWFTDWGRDAMISVPGICLCSGRVQEAREILEGFSSEMHQGLIPNRFMEQGSPEFNTADATLWFFQAVYETLRSEWDAEFAVRMFDVLRESLDWHLRGTLFGIRTDPEDGLLTQGEAGYQLTWMDVKIGDWVVTPRHGKPVEVNGLWVNALRILEWLAERLGHGGRSYAEAAERAEQAFERKFWVAGRGHYYDTVDPYDATLRPNQLIAMSLPFGPAKGDRAKAALDVVTAELLTAVGLRTLGPKEPGYRGRFDGPLTNMDAAYHQGTVWPWLLGPYVTALLKLTGDTEQAERVLLRSQGMLVEYGIGGIAELYDGDPPHRPNGCPFQAWSVGEILRAWRLIHPRSEETK